MELKMFLTHKNEDGEGIEIECRKEPALSGDRNVCNVSE